MCVSGFVAAGLLAILGASGKEVSAESVPGKLFVVNFTGDVSDKVGAAIAEAVSAELKAAGLQEPLTQSNLEDQLGQEKAKEMFGCKDDSCINEIIDGFGIADRLFGKITRLGVGRWQIAVSHFRKGKLINKKVEEVSCSDSDLAQTSTLLARAVMGLAASGGGGSGGVEDLGGGSTPVETAAPAQEWLVEFESEPSGAMVEVDGVGRRETKCSDYLTEGAHRVRMTLARYEAREGTLVVKGKEKVQWKLSPAIGWVDITSDPAGLAVEIRHEKRGTVQRVTTPATSQELDPGTYVVETVAQDFHSDRKRVTLAKGQRLPVKLTPLAREGYLKVKAFDDRGDAVDAQVKVGRAMLGTTPGPWKLRVGKYELEVSSAGRPTEKTTVEVEEGQTSEVTVKMRGGGVSGGGSAGSDTGKAGVEWVWSQVARLSFAKSETTVGQYRACVEAGACEAKHHQTKSDNGYCNWGYSDRDRHPMNCVDWHGARAYCEWAGGRLPTEEEWYAEASNGGKRAYPWGDREVSCNLAIWGDGNNPDGCGQNHTWAVCSKTAGNSVSGLCDLSGNVWEWTSSEDGAGRVVRGGSWRSFNPEPLRASARARSVPVSRDSDDGFRCVRSSP
jgi:formylglycine-generating enzyme required for sulfatase activity